MTLEQRQDLDAELRAFTLGGDTMTDRREAFASFMEQCVVPGDVVSSDTTLGGRPALRVEPVGGATRPGVILYFHGGAWIVGSPQTALGLTGQLVSRTGMEAVSVDYRLAPEHPFPAGIDDGVAAYRELLQQGVDPSRIVVAGDSAGGGLSITTLLAARREGLPMPGAVVTFSAGLDATRTGRSMDTKDGVDPIFSRASFAATTPLYLDGADPAQELLSPATLASLEGFPPLLLQVGTNEVLLDDTVRLAQRAIDASVDVVLDVTADVPHVFQMFAGRLDEADAALARAAAFVAERVPA
ncbi:alpha/beta hydrolase [Frondihabitans australicus]|uniref:Acetyl esterase/lipase n=1 Tax=Frondihabitans australicus TaxID=386892 RepID=A0A495IJD5_9MICO|nr:alpha/beta hydrolase [Frondihabitans australicus]RKR75401.1 acetyl esterase/lipase [Frondihabitans australicus]